MSEYPHGFYKDVTNCARCGGNHPRLEVLPLTNPADDWAYWSMCPVLWEPILTAVVNGGESKSPRQVLKERPKQGGRGITPKEERE